ncbi:MAG: hypothetical protein D6677_01855 [Calditrichaeota bacterium]|nr:MAG: hypothetical protein D6677_01855 [Calditrichota bacterium]
MDYQIGRHAEEELSRARIQAHQATQWLAAVGVAYIPHRPDDSHTNIGWLPRVGAWGTDVADAGLSFRAALDMAGMRFHIVTPDGRESLATLDLDGRTFQEGARWFTEQVTKMGGDLARFTTRLHYEIPANDYGEGAAFDVAPSSAFVELNDHFLLAREALTRVAGQHIKEPRIWPHHFDLGILIDLNDGRSIGLGLSPGDEHYHQPYYYVSPWPYPDDPNVLRQEALIPGGHWHTHNFTAAVLPASEYGGDVAPLSKVTDFLRSARRACERILMGS